MERALYLDLMRQANDCRTREQAHQILMMAEAIDKLDRAAGRPHNQRGR
ncbi:hypothetical protein S-CBP42_0037 [Synechococcus phage S-CBP42]|uniref:Uncharacterized protein n=1 Tax=Synechococcus phage S-CBP42 TaxID=461711 RepID=A0A096VKV7_9CAUD|nr:hypothetical protein AVU76_gp37 [Synechococcus phage S-CBP42]AGK86688.1 hypothetical protein S-CBP42_0037 [Synechococcus phage S-CBP42]